MKPLLIMPPAPARWPPLEELLRHKGQPWLRDIERRTVQGVPGAQDVYGVVPAGGQFLANACINKYGDVGVLGHYFTRPEHRRQGHARRLIDAVVSWFDMTGGSGSSWGQPRSSTRVLSQVRVSAAAAVSWSPFDRVTLWRPGRGERRAVRRALAITCATTRAGMAGDGGDVAIQPRARTPCAVDESAVNAEVFALDLIDHQERGLRAQRGVSRTAAGGLGHDRDGTTRRSARTMLIRTPEGRRNYGRRPSSLHRARVSRVDFPMEGLRAGEPGRTGDGG
jgi:GNAT superfamily N-acetyltransferase